MARGDKLIGVIKEVSKKANPSNKNADIVYGIVQSISPLTVLVDNRFSLTEEFLIFSPFCHKTEFQLNIPSHKHNIDVEQMQINNHTHSVTVSSKSHTHKIEDKTTEPAGNGSQEVTSTAAGSATLKPVANCDSAGSILINVCLWGDLIEGEKLVMLRAFEGQSYLVLYRDRLKVEVSCQAQ